MYSVEDSVEDSVERTVVEQGGQAARRRSPLARRVPGWVGTTEGDEGEAGEGCEGGGGDVMGTAVEGDQEQGEGAQGGGIERAGGGEQGQDAASFSVSPSACSPPTPPPSSGATHVWAAGSAVTDIF